MELFLLGLLLRCLPWGFQVYAAPTDVFMQSSGEEWDTIFKCATYVNLKKGEHFCKAGEKKQELFQIASGSLRVSKPTKEGSVQLGIMRTGEIGGEISFLFGGGVTVDLVADTDLVEVYVVGKTFVEKVFGENPHLAGKFYLFLASQISNRLRKKEDVLEKETKQEPTNQETVQQRANSLFSVQGGNSRPRSGTMFTFTKKADDKMPKYKPFFYY